MKGLITRRAALKTAGAGSFYSSLSAGNRTEMQDTENVRDVYQMLGVPRIINAAGTITTLGGSLMPPEVTAAWKQASQSFVPLLQLQDRIGEAISKLLQVDAALVTTGAAGGILLGTAAAMTYRDHNLIEALPVAPEEGWEVIRQKSHQACYDHQITACGVRLVEVETVEELYRSIHKKTVMMMAYNVHEENSTIRRSDWLAAAKKRGVPTLLDAAADTPPLDRMWKYNHMGYDMVVFSGGKGLRGPQGTGLLLGRKELIEAAKRNTSPYCSNLGRGMKVSKEDMVAMWAALDRFVHLDHRAEWDRWLQQIREIETFVEALPTVTTKTVIPPIANHVPHLVIDWDQKRIPLTPAQMKIQLSEGDPSISIARVHGTGQEGFLVSVFVLQPGESAIVGGRIKSIFETAMDGKK